MKCPCGSNQDYVKCCQPFITGKAFPDTAEKLMRSRYSAFAQGEIEYIKVSTAPEAFEDFDLEGTKKWATESKWKGLKILNTEKGGPSDKTGVVEFVATFEKDGKGVDHHEISTFRKDKNGKWLFLDGDSHSHAEGEGHSHSHAEPQIPVQRAEPKVGRNDLCPCGSGKKYKKCCGA